MSNANQFCTFYLDRLLFGVELQKVQEVIRYQDVTRVPLAPRVVSGLINLRGQIVTAVDLRKRLDLPERPEGKLPMNVVMRTEDGGVSLQVDEIGDVVEVSEESSEEVPPTLQGVARELIKSACKLQDRLLLVLDIEKSCQFSENPAQVQRLV